MRTATRDDVPRIVSMAQKFHAEHGPAWPFRMLDAAVFFTSLIESPNGLVLVTDRGFAAAVANQNPMARDWVTVSQLLLWDEGNEGGVLWRGLVRWVKDIGAQEFRCSCHPENKRVAGFMASQGAPDEIVYSRVM